ncbi:MAG TPA: PilZ domain-containing protein [Polyangiaceae bacterium]
MSRRSSSPSIPIPPGEVHGTRRAGGSRREATDRVRVRREEFQTSGWTLNISRGGARLVLEESVELGAEYTVQIGSETEPREVRIVWAQDEADGQIVGVQFLDTDGSVPPPLIVPSSVPPPPKGAA